MRYQAYILILMPEIIELYVLAAIVSKHDAFDDTIFRTDPELLYHNTLLNFVEMDGAISGIHFVLMFPILRPEHQKPLFQIFRTISNSVQ